MVYVPAMSDIAHRTLAAANSNAKAHCRPILPSSETEDVSVVPMKNFGVVTTVLVSSTQLRWWFRAMGALVKASTGPTVFSVYGDVVT